MKQYIIDPRLEVVCLPLTKDEYDKLESQIKRDGCLDPVKVWDRDGELVLLDGHNRLKICKDNKLPVPESTTIEISSIDEAVIWICDNQEGRRNVATQKQQDYLSGKRYEAQKNINRQRDAKGVFKSNAPCQDNMDMDERCDKWHYGRTVLKQAKDEGVSHFKIQSNEKFAKGVDAIREVSPKLADEILKPLPDSPKLTKGTVIELPKIKEKEPEKFVEAVKQIEEAIATKDKTIVEMVVHAHVKPDEPTHEEKVIAKRHHLKPEHVRYANEHNIPYENLRTVEQIDAINARKTVATCSTAWDGFYECGCGIKFEIFGSEHAPICCPHCGKNETLKRMR